MVSILVLMEFFNQLIIFGLMSFRLFVSILVLMEFFNQLLDEMQNHNHNHVSILVLMEFFNQLHFTFSKSLSNLCFNPCFNGIF